MPMGELGKDLTVGQVNQSLGSLERAGSLAERAKVLSQLLVDCNPLQMKYLVMIILKDLKATLPPAPSRSPRRGLVPREGRPRPPAPFDRV